ncbi:MAG: hypothetical protein U0930_08360, partial [Pirellulales bacterium]
MSYRIHPSEIRLSLGRPLVCFNSLLLSDELRRVPEDVKRIVVEINPHTGVVDHTACENLMYDVEESNSNGREI